MRKEVYEVPVMEVIAFETEDVIVTSFPKKKRKNITQFQ